MTSYQPVLLKQIIAKIDLEVCHKGIGRLVKLRLESFGKGFAIGKMFEHVADLVEAIGINYIGG